MNSIQHFLDDTAGQNGADQSRAQSTKYRLRRLPQSKLVDHLTRRAKSHPHSDFLSGALPWN